MKFYPYELAELILLALDLKFDVNDLELTKLTPNQLKLLKLIKIIAPKVIKNANKTLRRMKSKKNPKNYNFMRNLQLTITGTLSESIINMTYEEGSASNMIKWLPSSSDEIRPIHALNYGKVMRLKDAQAKGLGKDINCKCGIQFLKPNKKIKELYDKLQDATKSKLKLKEVIK